MVVLQKLLEMLLRSHALRLQTSDGRKTSAAASSFLLKLALQLKHFQWRVLWLRRFSGAAAPQLLEFSFCTRSSARENRRRQRRQMAGEAPLGLLNAASGEEAVA